MKKDFRALFLQPNYCIYFQTYISVAVKGVGEVGDGPGPRASRGLAYLTPALVCIGITFSHLLFP
jgi:hypothetical protein